MIKFLYPKLLVTFIKHFIIPIILFLQMKAGIVNHINNQFYRDLANIKENDIVELERLFTKYKTIFHPNHFHLTSLKHTLSQVG